MCQCLSSGRAVGSQGGQQDSGSGWGCSAGQGGCASSFTSSGLEESTARLSELCWALPRAGHGLIWVQSRNDPSFTDEVLIAGCEQ